MPEFSSLADLPLPLQTEQGFPSPNRMCVYSYFSNAELEFIIQQFNSI